MVIFKINPPYCGRTYVIAIVKTLLQSSVVAHPDPSCFARIKLMLRSENVVNNSKKIKKE